MGDMVWNREDFTMHKLIITISLFAALLSTGILHVKVAKENSVKIYPYAAAQFAYHVPDTQYCCPANHLF